MVGEVEAVAVGCPVFPVGVYLSVGVASSGALPFPAGVVVVDGDAGPKPGCRFVGDFHRLSPFAWGKVSIELLDRRTTVLRQLYAFVQVAHILR